MRFDPPAARCPWGRGGAQPAPLISAPPRQRGTSCALHFLSTWGQAGTRLRADRRKHARALLREPRPSVAGPRSLCLTGCRARPAPEARTCATGGADAAWRQVFAFRGAGPVARPAPEALGGAARELRGPTQRGGRGAGRGPEGVVFTFLGAGPLRTVTEQPGQAGCADVVSRRSRQRLGGASFPGAAVVGRFPHPASCLWLAVWSRVRGI